MQYTLSCGANSYLLRTGKVFNFNSDQIVILSDGRCIGACAVFVRLMQGSAAARTV
jgi:hypothetical protein